MVTLAETAGDPVTMQTKSKELKALLRAKLLCIQGASSSSFSLRPYLFHYSLHPWFGLSRQGRLEVPIVPEGHPAVVEPLPGVGLKLQVGSGQEGQS